LTINRIRNYNSIKTIKIIGIDKYPCGKKPEVRKNEAFDKRQVRSQGIAGYGDLPE
jgi:hypothetical protein